MRRPLPETTPDFRSFALPLDDLARVPLSEAVIARAGIPKEAHIRSCRRGRLAGSLAPLSPSGQSVAVEGFHDFATESGNCSWMGIVHRGKGQGPGRATHTPALCPVSSCCGLGFQQVKRTA